MAEQNLKTFENALKEFYLPVWNNQLGIEPSPLLAKIKKEKIMSDIIVSSAPMGLSGGFGFGAEGEKTPAAGNVNFARFKTRTKDMYVNIAISEKAVSLTGTAGAMANALDTEVKAAYEAAKWNVGRALFGNGDGILTTVAVAQTSAGTELKVSSVKNLKEGLIIDIYASGATIPTVSGLRITAINRTPESDKSYIIKLSQSTGSAIAKDSFITVQYSYKREITGLGAIFDDSVTSLYGVSKADNPFLKPTVISAEGEIADDVITQALRTAERDKNGKVDMLLCGDTAFDKYVKYLRTDNRRIEDSTKILEGGFKAIKFLFGNREVDVVNEGFVPDDEAWGIDTSVTTFHHTDWKFSELQGGGIFNLMESQSVYRALLRNYGDLICANPGGCVRITNCSIA